MLDDEPQEMHRNDINDVLLREFRNSSTKNWNIWNELNRMVQFNDCDRTNGN